MRRIIHLSDLHFGRVNPDLKAPLLRKIEALKPDLVVISGDLTQRARPNQFREAAAFIAQIGPPVLCVPGNHDTPLYNLFQRFFAPFSRYKRYISEDLEPVYADPEVTVVGLNTVNPRALQRGKFGKHARARVCLALGEDAGQMRIVALHHPPEQAEGADKRLMKGARKALHVLSACGADVVLSGHLHQAATAPFRAAPDLLFVQAGTGLSTRVREQGDNTFNQLDITRDALRVVTWSAQGAIDGVFIERDTSEWRRDAGLWRRAEA
ncbi:metallophosphoesterase family protein [Albirhodobacter sp. R86504]|uniref:metallophosphoesterase family protein n=1 Tax=Albirhodobacter sp. R86504 TaxID=3093848 RepID=UPI00366B98D5